MKTNKKETFNKAFLLLSSVLFTFVFLLLGELFCRHVCQINFQGTSKNLFIQNAYGPSKGNAKNAEALAFGVKVYTDENGFRISPLSSKETDNSYKSAILILGDSVGFGPGVEEDKTVAGLLRQKLSKIKIYNSSVIGYRTEDYKNVITYFLSPQIKIDKVYLIYCLNDISHLSAQRIDRALKTSKQEFKHSKDIVSSIKKFKFISELNDFLRSTSKLYLLLRNLLTDPQKRYWRADYQLYADENNKLFLENMKPLDNIAMTLKDRGIAFTVIISPYEYQLRTNDRTTFVPQKKLAHYFDKKGINYRDGMAQFKDSGIQSKKLFLPYDPMHLSEEGHKVLYDIIMSDW